MMAKSDIKGATPGGDAVRMLAIARWAVQHRNQSRNVVLDETALEKNIARRLLKLLPSSDDLLRSYAVRGVILAEKDAQRKEKRRAAQRASLSRDQTGAATNRTRSELMEEAFTAALSKLKPDDVELLRLYYWKDLTEVEIARSLGRTRGAVSGALKRARKSLFKELVAFQREHPAAAAAFRNVKEAPR